jgi:hypothetical protein
MDTAGLYDRDFYEWAVRNAELLRSGRVHEADLSHIAEELEDMGKRERRALLSRLSVLLAHLLKWQAQPDLRSRSWEATMRLQRREMARLMEEMPSLRPFLLNSLEEAYQDAVAIAVAETNLPEESFAATCPFHLEDVLAQDYLP